MDPEYILFCTPEQPETSANRQFRCSWSGGRSTMQASKGLRQRRPGAGFFPVRRRSACLGCRAAAGETARRGIRSIASLHARLPITGLAHAALLSSRSQHARPLCRPEGLRRIGRSRVAFQPPAQGRTRLVAVHGDRQKLATRNFADSGAEPVEALRSAFSTCCCNRVPTRIFLADEDADIRGLPEEAAYYLASSEDRRRSRHRRTVLQKRGAARCPVRSDHEIPKA